MQKITIEEFEKSISGGEIPKMQSSLYENIVRFYLTYPQNDVYAVSGEHAELLRVFSRCEDVYTKFGINPNFSDYKRICAINHDKEYIIFLDDSSTVSEQVNKFSDEFGCMPTYAAILVRDVNNKVNDLHSVLPNCIVMNRKDVTEENYYHVERNTELYQYVELTDKLTEVYRSSIDFDGDIMRMVGFLEEIRKEETNPRIIYYIDHFASSKIKNLFIVVASILTFEGYNFEIPADGRLLYFSLQQKMLSRDSMLLGDYLEKIANPVTFATYVAAGRAYLCLLDHQDGDVYQKQDFELQLFEIPMDDSTYGLRSRTVKCVKCPYSQLQVLDPVQIFNLENENLYTQDIAYSNRSIAMVNNIRLGEIIAEFEEIIDIDVALKNDTALNFTNVLFYRRDGQMYIAYVPTMPDLHYHYIFVPLCNRYRNFKQVLDLHEYDQLMDINIFAERDILFQSLGKYTFNTMRHFKKPRFLNGALLKCFPANKYVLSHKCRLSLPAIGIWSIQSSQGRSSSLNFLLERFNRPNLRSQRFLTFWGGCNPIDNISLVVDYKLWRDQDDSK